MLIIKFWGHIFNEQCEGVCPQHLPIIELLKDAAAILDV